MAALKKIGACLLVTALAACSMQPLIDLGLPRDDATVTRPSPPSAGDAAETDTRATGETEAPRVAELPRAALALVSKADQQLALGDSPAAIASLERALAMAPRAPQLYFELAKAYAASNDTSNARNFANKALSLSPPIELEREIHLLLTTLSRVSLF